MSKDKSMKEDELKAIVRAGYDDSRTYTDTIASKREKSLKAYRRDKYGDEEEGLSQVVTSEVFDSVEWALPIIIEMFLGENNPVQFLPRNSDDVIQAKNETESVLYTFWQENSGFLLLYTWFKDALISKNGITKAYWQETVLEEKETYEGLSEEEFQVISNDPEVEIREHSIFANGVEMSEEEFEFIEEIQELTHDVVVMRRSDNSQVKIKNVAPERFHVDKDWTSLDLADCPGCYEVETLTYSDLINEGYSKKIVESIFSDELEYSGEEATRRQDEGGRISDTSSLDKSRREIDVIEAYIRVDYDGDGISELRMVKIAGGVVLENEEADSVPYYSITPIINTHKFYGESYADITEEIQRISTVLMRQVLNNVYLSNVPRKVIIDGQVNREDLNDMYPGATVRARSLDSIRNEEVPFVAAASLPIFDRLEKQRHERTGVSPLSQGLAPDLLSDTTNPAAMSQITMAQARLRMVARVFAETGVRSLFLGIHALLRKHENKEKLLNIVGNEFIPVDPRDWRKRTTVKIAVGVGHATKEERTHALNNVLLIQEKIVASGGRMVDEQNIYNAITELAMLGGLKDHPAFYTDPSTLPPPEPQEDPISEALQIEEARTVARVQEAATKAEIEVKKFEEEMRFEREKFEEEMALKKEELVQKIRLREKEIELGRTRGGDIR